MTDPVLALVLLAAFFPAMALAHLFKTVDTELWRDARTPVIAGVVCGVLLRFLELPPVRHIVVTAVLLTAAALYVRLTGRESEPSDGMTLGALMGAAAALPIATGGGNPLRELAECILAGAVAGFGITFALTHVTDRLKQFLVDAVTAGVAIAAAYLPTLAVRFGLTDRRTAIATAAALPLLLVATVFKQWPSVRAELRHEASLGFIDEDDVRATAHPLLRLGRAGWHDAGAHREFVRIATRIALRKRQQRNRSEEVARLYQVEIIKLRMQLQEMSRIDHMLRMQAEASS